MSSRPRKEVDVFHICNLQQAQGTKYSINFTGKAKRSLKRCSKRKGFDETRLKEVLKILVSGAPMPPMYLKHELNGKFRDSLECHIAFDLVLIWRQNEKAKELSIINIGTHSELFDKMKR